jgi:hypothetical protein
LLLPHRRELPRLITNADRVKRLRGVRREEGGMDAILTSFIERGDLAHLALFLWASVASALLAHALRELVAANKRFDEFVRALSRFNERHARRK